MTHANPGAASTSTRIRPRDRDAIVQSLRAGVVPRNGLQHIQVGRSAEITALVDDLARISNGGAGSRFVIGDYGSGKTFFLHVVRTVALNTKLVTMHADLSPDRRLHATGGQARSLYTELTRNMATRAKPDGGALGAVVEKFVAEAISEAKRKDGSPEQVIRARLESLAEMTGGYDFAAVIAAYWRGHDTDDDSLKSAAVRWLRGEYSTRTDARAALGIRTIVDDANFYDHLKLLARFTTMAGYGGLLICLDEMVNLYKLANTQARNANYEQILRIVNDSLQGSAAHLGFLFGGTPEFLTDTRRGMYSYAALQSRLAENTFATAGVVDTSGPVLRLSGLTQEDFFVLLGKLATVYASGTPGQAVLDDEAVEAFMRHCANRIGEAYFRTPRTTIKAFLDLLAVLEQNPGLDYRQLLGQVDIAADVNPDLEPLPEEDTMAGPAPRAGDDDELSSFRL
jgi:hypothetical protein